MSDGGNGQASFQDTFKEQAEWRREKAKEYPADERNLKAASAFDRLAATVDAIPRDVFEAYSELGGVHDGRRQHRQAARAAARPSGEAHLWRPIPKQNRRSKC